MLFEIGDSINKQAHISHLPLVMKSKGSTSCVECNKGHKFKHQLEVHLHMHKMDWPRPKYYQCGICFKSYTYKGNLRNHMAVHTTKKYRCTVCNELCLSKSGYKKHMLTHNHKENSVAVHSKIDGKEPLSYTLQIKEEIPEHLSTDSDESICKTKEDAESSHEASTTKPYSFLIKNEEKDDTWPHEVIEETKSLIASLL